jgi:hypothetical protein
MTLGKRDRRGAITILAALNRRRESPYFGIPQIVAL